MISLQEQIDMVLFQYLVKQIELNKQYKHLFENLDTNEASEN